jgi:hypothetical protein
VSDENEEKYGEVAGTIVNEVEKGVQGVVDTVSSTGIMVQNVGGYLKRDIPNALNWLTMSPEERAAQKQKEAEEQERADAEQKAKEEAEAQRMEELQKSYIVHTAMVLCDKAGRQSNVVLTQSHGEFIHGMPQLNVGDNIPFKNILTFGICRSPENPTVQQAAAKVIADVKEETEKGFFDKVMDLISAEPSDEVGKDLAAQCAGACMMMFETEWIDGKEDVLVDGKPALLGRCKLQCIYGGVITLYTSGQVE